MSGNIIQLNEDLIKNNLKDLVRDSVEETLNALLDHEADELVRAGKYERILHIFGVSSHLSHSSCTFRVFRVSPLSHSKGGERIHQII